MPPIGACGNGKGGGGGYTGKGGGPAGGVAELLLPLPSPPSAPSGFSRFDGGASDAVSPPEGGVALGLTPEACSSRCSIGPGKVIGAMLADVPGGGGRRNWPGDGAPAPVPPPPPDGFDPF